MSVHYDLLYNLKNRMPLINNAPPVVIRKKSVLLQTDTTPIIILSPGKVYNVSDYFENKVERVYQVNLSYIRPGDRDYSELECMKILEIEEGLREEIFQPLLDNTQSIDCNLEEKPPFEVASGDRNNYDISGYIIKYTLMDTRKS